MPAGTFDEFWTQTPDTTLLAHSIGTDAAGNKITTFIYEDPATGFPGITKIVKTGAVEEAPKPSGITDELEAGRVSSLLAVGLAPAVMTATGQLTKGSRDKILGAGVPPTAVDDIWEAIVSGATLNEIRQAITQQLGNQDTAFGYLDKFMVALQETKSGVAFDDI